VATAMAMNSKMLPDKIIPGANITLG